MASTHDVCIVGAGIAGSSLAYYLAPEFRQLIHIVGLKKTQKT
jgi:flavin-dependent dehydrogenase